MDRRLNEYLNQLDTHLTACQEWAQGSVQRWIIYGCGIAVLAFLLTFPIGFVLGKLVHPVFGLLLSMLLWVMLYVPLGVVPYLDDMKRELGEDLEP